MLPKYQDLLQRAYALFNAREIDGLLQLMDPAVQWANGWEGGYVHGHDQVREYWTRQWKEINPTVTPVAFVEKDADRVEVEVHQMVKDLEERLLFEGKVHHLYTFENNKVKRMEIVSTR